MYRYLAVSGGTGDFGTLCIINGTTSNQLWRGTIGDKLDCENAFCLFAENTELRQFIVDRAKALTDKKEWQAELVAYAWTMLSKSAPQRTTAYYKRTVGLLMHRRMLYFLYNETWVG